VIRLRLPALRERNQDVPALTRFFLQKSAKELGVEAKRITDAALARLTRFDFPGNVRQLENICHWLTVMAPSQMIEAKDLPPELQTLPAAVLPPMVAAVPVDALAVVAPAAHAPIPVAVTSDSPASPAAPAVHWLAGLEQDARSLLLSGQPEVWDTLTRKFEAQLIHTALEITRGRRIEAAQKLGIGRNTITRKIQELGLDD
jgi:two-component system, NtrC family, nitrogen regulation response regulator GlnG